MKRGLTDTRKAMARPKESDERRNEVRRRTAFEELFLAHYKSVLGYALRRSPANAHDVAAETFLVAWRRSESIPDDSLPWLYGVARRTLANQRRAETRRGALVTRLRQEHGTSPVMAMPADRSDAVTPELRAFRRLSERDQEVLALIAWEDLDNRQAAAVLGCSTAALAVRLHRARARLARSPELQRHAGGNAGPLPTPTRPKEIS